MERVFKRIISFVLCVLFVFTVAAPAATVEAAASSNLPIVYIKGRSTTIYNKNGEKIYPFPKTLSEVIDENMSSIVSQAVKSYTTNNWSYLSDKLYEVISPLYKDMKLNKNGEVSNSSYIKPQPEPKKNTKGNYGMTDYLFEYDSRLDPWALAGNLRTYINKVLNATGKKKVRVVARCMGSDILAAYLVRYKGDPKIDTSVFYASACNGVLMVGAAFSGKIQFDRDSLAKYAEKNSDNTENEFAGMISTFYKLFGKIGMKLGADVANSMVTKAAPSILPRLVIATYGTMPGYWAMVGSEYYEDAIKTVFGKNARTGSYKNLVSKTDRYQYNVQKKLPSVLKDLKKKGMRINFIVKYNIDFEPLFEGSKQQGDGYVEAKNMAFGAKFADKDKTLSESYIKKLTNSGLANYISSDKIIDASAGAFPDYTWYIKNMHHIKWPSCVNNLIFSFFNGTSQVTVTTNKSYPQFTKYSGGKLVNIYNYSQKLNPTLGAVTLSPSTFAYDGSVKTPAVVVKDTANKKLTEGTDYTVSYPSGRKSIGTYTVTVKFKGKYKGKAAKKVNFKIVPADVKVNTSISGNKVTLSWSKVAGASKYRVYGYDSKSKSYVKLTDTTATSYKPANTKAGGTYKYYVKAMKTVSGTTYSSASYKLVVVNLTPAAPTIKVTAGEKKATISWSKMTGGSEYEIYRGNSKSGSYRKVGTTTDLKYTDTGLWKNRTYYYKVRTVKIVDDKKLYSGFSAIQSVKVK